MRWSNNSEDEPNRINITSSSRENRTLKCPSCGHTNEFQDQVRNIHDLPGLPAGVRFDPTDQEILEHLEAKVCVDMHKIHHPLIDEFIQTLDGENGICYTHPEKLPGVSKDGQIRHFFHRPSKAYTTGTRKRRKVHTDDEDGSETRWHKTGKTRPVIVGNEIKGFKKILVLYTNYGRQRKPEKTYWVMHQYHLGNREEEKDGELVAAKIFYQTQPRQCGSSIKLSKDRKNSSGYNKTSDIVDYYNIPSSYISYEQHGSHNRDISSQTIPTFVVQGADESSFVRVATESSKGKLVSK